MTRVCLICHEFDCWIKLDVSKQETKNILVDRKSIRPSIKNIAGSQEILYDQPQGYSWKLVDCILHLFVVPGNHTTMVEIK